MTTFIQPGRGLQKGYGTGQTVSQEQNTWAVFTYPEKTQPISALVQVQELLGQNDEADMNTHDFKQILTKFKYEFETISTT